MQLMPQIGDKIYVPSAYFIDRGEDDVCGGLATIKSIEINQHLGAEHFNGIFVTFKEIYGHSYNWKVLMESQDEYKIEYAGRTARNDPDFL